MRFISTLMLLALLGGEANSEPLRVASLNPVVGDLARQVGGDLVDVLDLMPVGENPHTFYPSPSDLKKAADSDLILAAGKGLETYLGEFRESLGADVPIVEVGRTIPSLKVEADEVFVCCPAHSKGAIDPHWWHSVKSAKRASRTIASALADADPAHAKDYMNGASEYGRRLDDLYKWVKRRIGEIPRKDRELTTAHAAFGYFCREFGMRSITVQGLTTEQNPDPGYLKDVIRTIKENDVRAVFPEANANPKLLQNMVRETGVRIGGRLLAGTPDAADSTYELMIRQNVNTIVDGLTGGTP